MSLRLHYSLLFFTPNKKISIEDANDRGEQRIPSERDPDHRDGDRFVVVEQNTQIEQKCVLHVSKSNRSNIEK